jgi:ABC-type transport system substrate-binding protein
MVRYAVFRSLCLVGFLTLAACAPAPAPNSQGPGGSAGSSSAQTTGPKTLLFGVRYELNDVGIQKGSDGQYRTSTGDRFGFESWVLAGSQNEKQGAIMSDNWRRAGFDVKEYVIPVAQSQDGRVRGTFPALSHVATFVGEFNNLVAYVPSQIGTPTNSWRGNNRGGWLNADYERLFDAYNSTLDRSERDRYIVEMMRVATDQLPVLFNFHNPNVHAYLSSLKGPAVGTPDRLNLWNVHEWELA